MSTPQIRIAIPNDGGLICAFHLRPKAPPEPLAWADVREGEWHGEGAIWLHFNLADVRAHAWIAAFERVPQHARDLLLGSDHHVRFERVGVGMFAVLGDMHHDLGATEEALGLLRLYADARLLITARAHPLKSIDRLRRDLQDATVVATPLQLAVHLLARIADMFSALVSEIGETVDEAEDRLLIAEMAVDSRELGRIRRFLARLRRHLIGTRGSDINTLLADWTLKSDAAAFRRVLQRFDAVAQDLDLVQVRARLLQEEIAARFSEATNRNIYFLSIVTTLLLPVSFITGVFGMNVGGLPFVHSENGFLWVAGMMIGTLLVSIVVLRWRRLF